MKSIKFFTLVCVMVVGYCCIECNANSCCGVNEISTTQKIGIINNTSTPVNVGFTLPEQTTATIQLKKLDALHSAVLSDSAEKIRKAVNDGADVNQRKDGKTLLFWAIALKRHIAVGTLLQLGAIPDDACAQQTIAMGDIQTVLLLVKQGYVNIGIERFANFGNTNDGFDLIRELASRGYDINKLWTPAISLANHNPSKGEEIIRFLLFRGANPNYQINSNHRPITTPLFLALDYTNKPIVKVLIEAGADINQKTNPCRHSQAQEGDTALSHAIKRNTDANPKMTEIIELLLEHGAAL